MALLDRFVRYVRINTQSDDTTGTTPSTECQKNLGNLLVKELLELGLKDAHMDEWGNVYGHLPGNLPGKIGLNAHMDTALEVSGENVKPCLVKSYSGGIIKLTNGLEMSPKSFPTLKDHIGHDLVVTDGNTLLGADDKAGIAIIMGALEFYHNHPEVEHHTICVCFTVDEEIGEGPLHFNYEKMGADFAYTFDGAHPHIIECENFNAMSLSIHIKGVSIHPGEGKDKLINAALVATELISLFPQNDNPFHSEGDQGFWHLTGLSGSSDEADINLIIRDFYIDKLENRVNRINEAIEQIKQMYPQIELTYSYKDQYENMKQYVDQKIEVVERAKKALEMNGLKPEIGRIRGGTDGATMSKNGLITPNLGTGSYNHHGRFEYLDVQELELLTKVAIDITRI